MPSESAQFTPDPWTCRIVVVVLGLIVLSIVLGAVVLGRNIPQDILVLGSASVGGLIGLLIPSPMAKSSSAAPRSGNQPQTS